MGYQDAKRKRPEQPTRVLAIMNQKGGVGKTTTAVDLAAALGEKKYKVLVVDIDPQGNSTTGLGVDKNTVAESVYDALIFRADASGIVRKTSSHKVYILPSTIQLAGAEVELVPLDGRETRLKEALAPIVDDFDYVFIDCPPSLGLLTVNALTACNALLIPIQCEFYALEGVTKLLESMKMVKARLNPDLDVFGVVMTMYDKRTTLSKQVAHEVRDFFGDKMFKTKIPRTVRLSEAPSYGMSIIEYDPSSKGAEAYRELAKEVIHRG